MEMNFKEEETVITTENNKAVSVQIVKLTEDAVVPTYAHDGDMGMDLTATNVIYDDTRDCYIYHTGIAVKIPEGYGMLLFPRSSNRNTEFYMTNHVGVVDSGYTGEILLCFKNRTNTKLINRALNLIRTCCRKFGVMIPNTTLINRAPYGIGERIAQAVVLPYPKVEFKEVEELPTTERGDNGHGSTGK